MPAKKKTDDDAEQAEDPGFDGRNPNSEDDVPANERTQPLSENEGGFKQVDGHGWTDEQLAERAASAAK